MCAQPGPSSSEGVIEYDAVVVSIGVKYRECCATVARTIVFAPTGQQREHYNALIRARGAALAALAPGGTTVDVYAAVEAELAATAPELLPHLTKNVGHGIGDRFKDKLTLYGKRAVALKAGQVFNLQIGLMGLDANGGATDTAVTAAGGGGGGGGAAEERGAADGRQAPKATYALIVADTVALVATNTGSGSSSSSGGGGASSSSSSGSTTATRGIGENVGAKRVRKIPTHPGAQVLTHADLYDTTLVCRRGGKVQNERLPYEILTRIFGMLDVISLGRASMVCTTWNSVCWPEADFGIARQMVKWEQKMFNGGVAPSISTVRTEQRMFANSRGQWGGTTPNP